MSRRTVVEGKGPKRGGGRYVLGIMLGLGVVFLNAVILQGITGASVGKMITGIRVVDAQGNVAGIGRAFLRWVFLLVDLGCFIVGLVSVLLGHRAEGGLRAAASGLSLNV